MEVATGGLIGLTFTGAGVVKTTCGTFGSASVALPNGLSITKPRIGWKIQTIVTYSNYTALEILSIPTTIFYKEVSKLCLQYLDFY